MVCLEGNGSRPSHKGDGWIVSEVMYTLNKTEVHSVCCGHDRVPCVLVLNDQGGQQMSISYDVTATLRSQTKHHEPTILSYGFEPGVAKRLNPEGRFYNELSPTIRADMGDNQAAVLTIENHPADSRVKVRDDGICQALTERMGTGGGNVPLVLVHEDIC